MQAVENEIEKVADEIAAKILQEASTRLLPELLKLLPHLFTLLQDYCAKAITDFAQQHNVSIASSSVEDAQPQQHVSHLATQPTIDPDEVHSTPPQ